MSRLSIILNFIRRQWHTIPPVRTADLTGKTVVVIGANTGIGFEAAKHFATMNAGRLILGCRSRERGELAVSRLRKETGYSLAELWLIDLAEFQSVKAFADKFEKEGGGRLDYLVLNAAVATRTYTATSDGYESTVQVNCLSPSLLALLLLPLMVETAKNQVVTPRIVVVSSEVHSWTTFDNQVLNSESPLQLLASKEYCTEDAMKGRYACSKLINVLFVRALSDRLRSHLIVNVTDPGFCVSELRRNIGGPALRAIVKVMEILLAWTAEQGSRNLMYAAIAGRDGKEEERDLHGAYISLFGIAEPGEFVLSEQGKEVQETLWRETLDILSDVDPRVSTIAEQYLS